jgi:isopentenyl diphosphate isomerase/L-lactate dehydrogenase-like FMN-dependent dehydrogenase
MHRDLNTRRIQRNARRAFLRFLAASPLVPAFGFVERFGCFAEEFDAETPPPLPSIKNVLELEKIALRKLEPIVGKYLTGGADDLKTIRANRAAFDDLQIRARRLVDVSRIDTSVELFGQKMETPIMLAPVGFLDLFDPGGEVTVARAAAKLRHQMIASTLSSKSIGDINRAFGTPTWFQLYPTPDRKITSGLIDLARAAGCRVMVLTVDTPVIGNRENHAGFLTSKIANGELSAGNLKAMKASIKTLPDPTLDWRFVDWLKTQWRGPLVLKGIVTHEDTRLCVEHGVDGVIVSNHGGRQLESLRATIECLPEVVEAAAGKMPVLIDGGFRRGTDFFKALAVGATAVCIGRPYVYGLAAYGQDGVEKVLDLLRAELVRDMQLGGTPTIRHISDGSVRIKKRWDDFGTNIENP